MNCYKIQSLLLNDSAWDETIGGLPAAAGPGISGSDNANAAVAPCIQNNTACNHTTKPAPTTSPPQNAYYEAAPFIDIPVLTEADGTRYLDNTTPGNGFRANGSTCLSFVDAVNGNDECPFRWELKMAIVCPNANATCNNPTVEIVGILKFRPNQNGSRLQPINDLRYRVSVVRGVRGKNRSEQFDASRVIAGAQGSGAGQCVAGSWQPVNLVIGQNDNNNAALAAPNIVVQPGTYNCSFSVTCFACGSLQGRLIHPGGTTTAPGALAGNSVLARVAMDNISFTATVPGNMQLQYWAQIQSINDPVTAFDEASFCLGMKLPDYAIDTKSAQISCVRIY